MESMNEEEIDREPLNQLLASRGPVSAGDLIPLLQELQTVYGYLPAVILAELSRQTRIPISRIYGVATFYEQFHLRPHGRHTVKCCRGTACHVNNGSAISQAVQKILRIGPGQTTPDMRFTFETVACLGTCFLAPVMMVNNDYYGHLNEEKAVAILKTYCDDWDTRTLEP